MALTFRQLHPLFMAEVSPIDLRTVHDQATFDQLRASMDRYGVLVFHDQPFTDADQLDFAERFDGKLHAINVLVQSKNRLGDNALTDISNLDEAGEIMASNARRRMYSLGNRLWHTDASFQDPPARYSMLHARIVPPVPADTAFSDLRAAYDALDPALQTTLQGLRAHHSIAYSRKALGFEFTAEEDANLQGAVHPLVRANPRTGRKSLYLAAYASHIIDWPLPDGRLLLRDLMDHAIQREFTYRYSWRVGDLVIWDNLATMHKAITYDDAKYKRELRRVSTLDLPLPARAPEPSAEAMTAG